MRAQVTVTLASAALACAPALWQVAACNATAVVEALHCPRRRGADNLVLLLTGPLRIAPCLLRSLVAFDGKALQENANVMPLEPV